MIAHVAEASENSGRVVFQLTAHRPAAPAALTAALCVARSFNAGLESLVAEDPQLLDFARFSFAREMTSGGGEPLAVSADDIEASLQHLAVSLHSTVAEAAHRASVPLHCRTLRDDPASAIAAACIENGPWNVAVLAQAVTVETQQHVAGLFEAVSDVTGIVVVGGDQGQTAGPVVAIVEHMSHVQPMLRAAQRLASGSDGEVHLIVFGGNGDETAWKEGQVRLLLGGAAAPDLILSPETYASPQMLAGFLTTIGAGFVIAKLDGALLPEDGGLYDFASQHGGPLFLVR